DEEYLLKDSNGARVTSKPISFRGDVKRGFGPHNLATFRLVFGHVLSKDARWLRLTRNAPEAGMVQWDFPAEGGAPLPAAPPVLPKPETPPATPIPLAPAPAPPAPTPAPTPVPPK